MRAGHGAGDAAAACRRGRGPFDLVFIDADKPNTAAYFDWALKLTRPGSLIIVDNVVRDGAVIDADSDDTERAGRAPLLERLAAEPRVERHGDPDRRQQRLRRLRDRARDLDLHSLPLSLKAVADWHRQRDRSYTPRAARKTGRFRTNPRHGAASVPPALETAGATRLHGSLTGAGESHASVLT